MYTLAIDTSTQMCSVAIFHETEGLKGEITVKVKLNHSNTLLILIDELFKNCNLSVSDIHCVAINKGPGSFTGLRIGMAFAKGLCRAKNIPLRSATSFEILAHNMTISTLPVLTLVDAKNGRVYGALFQKNNRSEVSPLLFVDKVDALLSHISEGAYCIIGDGAVEYKQALERLLPNSHFVSSLQSVQKASMLADICSSKPNDILENLEPYYLLRTQAEEELEKKGR